MDWADEKAHELLILRVSLNPPNSMEISAALRKAKADGMREAAGIVDNELDWAHPRRRVCAAITARASQIEKGQ